MLSKFHCPSPWNWYKIVKKRKLYLVYRATARGVLFPVTTRHQCGILIVFATLLSKIRNSKLWLRSSCLTIEWFIKFKPRINCITNVFKFMSKLETKFQFLAEAWSKLKTRIVCLIFLFLWSDASIVQTLLFQKQITKNTHLMDYEWYFDTYQLSFMFHSVISYLRNPTALTQFFCF